MITVTQKVFFTRGTHGRRRIVDKPPPVQTVPEGRVPRLSKRMALALQFEELIRTRYCLDMTELARLGHVTQPRMTQIMNLLHLAPDVQEEILFLPRTESGRDAVILAQLQAIAQVPDWRKQRALWREMLRDSGT